MTIKDIARKTGVSPSAVSLVLNGKASGRVSAAKQEAILRVAAASGFQLNLSARRLRGKSLRLVGVAMPSPIVTCYGMMADRLHSHCTERGYSVIFAFWDSYASTSAAYAALQRQDVDGLIAWENRHPEAARSTPTVMFGCRLDDFDCIQYDFESIVPTAYDHLRQLGHRDFGFYAAADDPRRKILQNLLQADGLPLRQEWFLNSSGNINRLEADLERFFTAPSRPTCVFCPNDSHAHLLSSLAQARGLKIPSDLSIIGFDNLPEAAWMNPPLTTFDTHMEKVAATLIDTLLLRIKEPDRPRAFISLGATFIVRQSTAPPPPPPVT
ncbi:MAG: LacI family DNA-binding transcriptional regulator [Lentisphaeria bacterium]